MSDCEESYLRTLKKDLKLPRQINLELTNCCNLQCSFCINKDPDFRKKSFIKQDLLDLIVKQMPHETEMVLCGIGEPTMHPNFCEIVEQFQAKFSTLMMFTNGQNLTTKILETIAKSSLKKITISLDYFDPIQYRKEKQGDVKTVLKGISALLDARNAHNSVFTIQINMLAQKDNEKDIVDALAYFTPILGPNDYIYSRNIKTLAGLVTVTQRNEHGDWQSLEQFKRNLSNSIDVSKYRVENWELFLQLGEALTKRLVCRHPFIYCMVLFNGDVSSCCVDFNGQQVLGNLLHHSMYDIWNGETYRLFRRDMEQLNFTKSPLCATCEEWYKYK
jgi:MoaA/NifB/PqqE/SkfB family radical SAM enzyme